MKDLSTTPLRTIRSFVIREGRFTQAQKKAFAEFWPSLGIELDNITQLNLNDYFPNSQPIILDVGFGNGDSLISLAQQRSDLNFVGVEVYRPGIGATLQKIYKLEIKNIRIINADVLSVLSKIADNALLGILVWFPDPWPKKRHHKRRLVQKEFLQEAIRIIETEGVLHLASDWQPYVEFMQEHVNQISQPLLKSCVEHPLKIKRPPTKFEQRGLRKGHEVSDLIYQVKK